MVKKGMSLVECVKYADEFISENGECLLLFDVNGFRKMNIPECYVEMERMMKDFNDRFSEYFPENRLATPTRKEKGFEILVGDSSWAGINSSEVIPKIIEYQRRIYSNIPLYWGVAKDGFDNERLKLVR